MRLFDFFRKKTESQKNGNEDDAKSAQQSTQTFVTKMDFETQKKGYIELGQICLNKTKQVEYSKFIENLKDYENDEEYNTTLNYVIDCLYQQRNYFIICLDWKQEITSFTFKVNHTLSENFDKQIELPQQNDYGRRASVSYDNVFKDFDKAINTFGFQLSFIDTNSDEYVVVVHKIEDLKKTISAIRKIGYDCLNSNSRKISG